MILTPITSQDARNPAENGFEFLANAVGPPGTSAANVPSQSREDEVGNNTAAQGFFVAPGLFEPKATVRGGTDGEWISETVPSRLSTT